MTVPARAGDPAEVGTTRARAGRSADRRTAAALRWGGLAALVWPFTLTTSPRWLIGPAVAAVVTWALVLTRRAFVDPTGRVLLGRCTDVVVAADLGVVALLLLGPRVAWIQPWIPALALLAAVLYARAARFEARRRRLDRIAAGFARAAGLLAVVLPVAVIAVAWAPLAAHRDPGGLPLWGVRYGVDAGWSVLTGLVVIALGPGLAALTIAGARFRAALATGAR